MKTYDTVNPCYKCERRHPNCHGVCEDYKRWVATGVEVKGTWGGWTPAKHRRNLDHMRRRRKQS